MKQTRRTESPPAPAEAQHTQRPSRSKRGVAELRVVRERVKPPPPPLPADRAFTPQWRLQKHPLLWRILEDKPLWKEMMTQLQEQGKTASVKTEKRQRERWKTAEVDTVDRAGCPVGKLEPPVEMIVDRLVNKAGNLVDRRVCPVIKAGDLVDRLVCPIIKAGNTVEKPVSKAGNPVDKPVRREDHQPVQTKEMLKTSQLNTQKW